MSIIFDAVSFSYNDADEVLHNIDLVIEDGEFLGIIGHTGSGKSTLAQLANALLVPAKGNVLINGSNTRERKLRRSIRAQVGLAFQYPETQLFANTVEEDVAFGPRNLKLPEAEIDTRVRSALESVGFQYDEIAKRSPFDLSGGQQRRVALAGILAMKPSVLVLDEPAAGMDPATAQEIREHLHKLHDDGMTIVLISHSMEDVAELCSQVLVLDHGKIHMQGPPAKIFSAENAEELRRINLGLPRAAKFALELREKGLDLGVPILTEQDLVSALVENTSFVRFETD